MTYDKAIKAWRDMQRFRDERERCKRYVFGDQWSDLIDTGTQRISEREFIMQQGQVPLKNNILRRIIRNVTGIYRTSYKVPSFSPADIALSPKETKEINRNLKTLFRQNRMQELLPRLLEEYLISGLTAVRITGKQIRPVTPDNFFFHSDGYDPRGWDIDMIGEMHHIGYQRLIADFCRTAADIRHISTLYADCAEADTPCRIFEVWHRQTMIFTTLHDKDNATLRIIPIEKCRKEEAEDSRSIIRSGWTCEWLAHDGTLLRKEPMCGIHPYVFKAYPFLDGEIHSYVSDIIDQQRYVNRLITLYDFIMKSSAKGVLLFPDESLPRGMTLDEVAQEWSRFNGVIAYKAQPGVAMPTQVSGNAANIGITELLKIEMQMLEDISGVSPTLQGKLENSNASGTLFARQNEAALTSLLDVIRSFDSFTEDIARRLRAT